MNALNLELPSSKYSSELLLNRIFIVMNLELGMCKIKFFSLKPFNSGFLVLNSMLIGFLFKMNSEPVSPSLTPNTL